VSEHGAHNHFRVAIIGSGFAGLGMAIRLKQSGREDFVILERAGDVGGTWRENTYPGCQCDVPSHLYSFSFAPNPNWSRTFSTQPEIWEYLRGCAERYGITPHIRFGHDVREAAWDEERGLWSVATSAGTFTAEVLIAGVGGLSEPSSPAIPGLESFEGAAFHTAQWNHEHDLTGKRVAVIGTGASAIQVVPKIQPKVARLHVFQRTPPWVMPHSDRPVSRGEKRLYRRFPKAQLAMRAAIYWARETFVLPFMHPRLTPVPERVSRRHLEKQVADPELRRKLTPKYKFGCKRVLPSNEYYPALTQPNVELVTDGIGEVRASSIVTEDGTEREVDIIVLGTGFRVLDMPVAGKVRGREGKTLDDLWRGSPEAHVGATISGFPNFFMLTGPNTGLGHNSIVFMIESQVAYVLDCLETMERQGIAAVEVRLEAQAAFNREIQKRLAGAVWSTGGCASWYLDKSGKNSTLWPGSTWTYRQRVRRFDLADYSVRPAS